MRKLYNLAKNSFFDFKTQGSEGRTKVFVTALMLFLGAASYAQTCTQSATASGTDCSGVTASVNPITCTSGGTITAITLNASLGGSFCPSWYTYNVIVNGVTVLTNQCNATGINLASYLPITSVAIQAVDMDNYCDGVNLSMSLNISYTLTACTSPVTAGTATVSSSPVCSGTTVSVGLTGTSIGSGITYQWQSSPDNTTWANITNATAGVYAATPLVETYYRCIVVCSGGTPDTSSSVQVQMNPFYNCYCNNSPTSTSYGNIESLNFSNISTYNPGTTCVGYTNFQNPANIGYVFQNGTYNMAAAIGSCTGTFPYNAYLTVYIDYNQNGSYTDPGEMVLGNLGTYFQTLGGNITIPATSLTGNTGMRVIVVESGSSPQSPCTSFAWGEVEDYTINISPPPANDAGVSMITRPAIPACTLGDSLFVALTNAGTDTLNSCVLNWSVNGITQTSGSFTGAVVPNTVSGDVFVGTYSFTAGDVVSVWTSGPNNVPDSFAANDTIQATMLVAMYGNYTIGGVNPDFPTFTDAVNALTANGVCDDVTFIVHDTTYVEQITIPQIFGSGPNATITFQSASGNDSTCILAFTTAGSGNNFTVKFNGADWITFKNMSIVNLSATYGRVLDFTAQAEHNTLENTNLLTDTLYNSTSTNKTVVYVTGTRNDYNTFTNSRLRGGSYSVYWFGASTANLTKELTFDDCEFTHYYYRGMYLYYHDSPKIRNSYFYSDKAYTSQYTLQAYYCDNAMEITGNEIIGNQFGAPLYAMYLYYCDGSPVNKSLIANNMVAIGDSTLSNSFYGMLMYYSGNSRIVNNSFNILGTSVNQRGLQLGYGGLVDVWNNNINVQTGMAIYSVDAYTIANTDYNNLKTGGATLGYFGTAQADLTAWQTATNQDANSMSVDPMFFGPKDLHVCSSDLDNAAASLSFVMYDNDGEMRQGTPDIGADEFSSIDKFSAGDDFVLCDGATADLMAAMNFDDTTIWMGTDTTHMFTVSTAGTYTVVSSNTCGIAYDTVMVTGQQHAALQNDTLICPGDQIIVDANVANGSYTWSGGESTQTITVSETGTYAVTVVDADGCASSDDILVQQPAGVNLSNDTTFCAGSSIFVDAGVPNASYNWSNGLPNSQIVSVNATGVYSVTVTDINGCVSTDAIDVTAIPQPDASFTSTVSFATFIGDVTNPYSGSTYTWDFGDGNSANGISVTHIYNAEGQFTVILTVENECGTANNTSEAGIDVKVEEVNASNLVKVYPNPNNGSFTLQVNNTGAEKATVEITDLQGRVVFVSNYSAATQLNEQIDLSNFANGIYNVKVTMNNSVEVVKVTVQK